MTELKDGGEDLVVKILDLFLLSSQLLKFKVRDLDEEKEERLCLIDRQLVEHIAPVQQRFSPSLATSERYFSSIPAPPHSPSCGGVSF